MEKIMKFFCSIGWHSWKYSKFGDQRKCTSCLKLQFVKSVEAGPMGGQDIEWEDIV